MMSHRALACAVLAAAVAPAAAQAPLRIDEKVIREAVRATVAEMPKLERVPAAADFSSGGTLDKGARQKIDRAFEAAEKPDCLHADATKHVPLRLGGWLGLPGWAYAAATGKCK
ncbi:hypothetical protein GTP41_13115 [Pseudoduganella sp. DS3]|uniref:UrcA family protein n=1 Tax=Pseudoduganella guangdongensis TaxID=2692179 RepID=A0A6N9HIU9_9BURK|nr:hypothetical protein [Pseudoduganella guangdongensis]MYN03043.1 hypothetical protein [Pseudoduganella guangdongensis]